MNHCLACGRGIEDSATVCDPCEQWASESVASSVPEAPAAAEPQNLSLFDTAPRAGEPGAAAPSTAAPYEAPAYHPAPDAALPFDTAPYDASPYDAMPYDAAPYDAASEDMAPYDAAPQAAAFSAAPAEAEAEPVTLAAFPHPASEPPLSAPEAELAAGRGLDRRILMMGGLAVAVGAVITLVMILAPGGAPAEVSAAPAAAPAPARPRKPVTRPAKTSIAGTLAASNAGQQWSTANRGYWVGKRAGSPAFELPAENTVAVWMNQVRPTLIVRCIAKNPEVFVVTESALKIEAQTTEHTVTYRFDEEPEFTDRWADSSEHDALFAPDGEAFALRLSRARTLRVGYTPHNAAPVVVNFQVSGLGALLEPVAKDCGLKK